MYYKRLALGGGDVVCTREYKVTSLPSRLPSHNNHTFYLAFGAKTGYFTTFVKQTTILAYLQRRDNHKVKRNKELN